jgi:hypothetical protein
MNDLVPGYKVAGAEMVEVRVLIKWIYRNRQDDQVG